MTPPRILRLKGIDLALRDLGDGPPVLLLHGNPDSHDLWDGVLAEAGRRGLRARFLLPDMPGFGDSPPPPDSFDYLPGSTVPLWDALLEELALDEPLLVVVHDFGGPWLLPWVARNAQRVAGLVICNAPFSPGYSWHFWARVWQTPLLGELTAAVSPRSLFRWEMRRGSKGLPVDYCDAAHARATPAMRRCVLRTYRAHARPQEVFAEELPRLQQVTAKLPGRVLWGLADPYLPAAEAEAFGLPVTGLEGVGHWSPVERPDAVVDAMMELEPGLT